MGASDTMVTAEDVAADAVLCLAADALHTMQSTAVLGHGSGSGIGGIGVVFRRDAGGPLVISEILEHGPAAHAGTLFEKDELVEVDGEDVRGLAIADVSRRVAGAPGSFVALTVHRREYASSPGHHVCVAIARGAICRSLSSCDTSVTTSPHSGGSTPRNGSPQKNLNKSWHKALTPRRRSKHRESDQMGVPDSSPTPAGCFPPEHLSTSLTSQGEAAAGEIPVKAGPASAMQDDAAVPGVSAETQAELVADQARHISLQMQHVTPDGAAAQPDPPQTVVVQDYAGPDQVHQIEVANSEAAQVAAQRFGVFDVFGHADSEADELQTIDFGDKVSHSVRAEADQDPLSRTRPAIVLWHANSEPSEETSTSTTTEPAEALMPLLNAGINSPPLPEHSPCSLTTGSTIEGSPPEPNQCSHEQTARQLEAHEIHCRIGQATVNGMSPHRETGRKSLSAQPLSPTVSEEGRRAVSPDKQITYSSTNCMSNATSLPAKVQLSISSTHTHTHTHTHTQNTHTHRYQHCPGGGAKPRRS